MLMFVFAFGCGIFFSFERLTIVDVLFDEFDVVEVVEVVDKSLMVISGVSASGIACGTRET
jgi:hypothetical protein